MHAGQMVELANYERLAASYTTTKAAPVVFGANADPEDASDHYVAVSDLLDEEMELQMGSMKDMPNREWPC